MADVYNLTNFTNATNILEIAVATDVLVGGMFFPVVISLVFIISFVGMKNYAAKDAFLAAGFISSVLAGVLWISGLLSEGVALIFFVLFVLGVAVHLLTE